MSRRFEFPEFDDEPEYESDYQPEYRPEYRPEHRRFSRRHSGGVGGFSVAVALLAIGALAAFVGVLEYGQSIPGMRRAPAVETALAMAPHGAAAVPQDNPIGLRAKALGVDACLDRIVYLSRFLTQRTSSDWLLTHGPRDADRQLFSATIASQENATGLRGISNFYAAPVGGGCDAAYQSTVYLPITCERAHESVFAAFVDRLDLGGDVAQAYAVRGGTARVYMLPAGENGCVAVKTEISY